jgi:hypothetical protein
MRTTLSKALGAAGFAASLLVATSASAVPFVGTPSPALAPVFGTLINFDDKATGTPVLAGDYAGLGVTVTELTGAGAAFQRYKGSQSQPNYIGTGAAYEIGGAGLGWDGTIRFEFSSEQSQVGIGVADSAGGPETISIYDATHALIDSFVVPTGANVYVGFQHGGIRYFEITGDFFAVDDLQFKAPEPSGLLLIALGLLGAYAARRRSA